MLFKIKLYYIKLYSIIFHYIELCNILIYIYWILCYTKTFKAIYM